MPITRNNSVSLDILRASAAMAVFLHHCDWLGMSGAWLSWFRQDVGHSAVVIFFVLSGYVIAATTRRSAGAVEYAIKRAARVYSVAIPAMLLVIALDTIRVHWQLPPDSAYELNKLWVYVPLAMSFTGDFWSLGQSAFSNGAAWSLGYEVWYYVVFGAAVFLPGAWRWVGVALVLALIGPKLLILLPLWLSGVFVLWLQNHRPLPRAAARLVALAAVLLFLAVKATHLEDVINAGSIGSVFGIPLRFSQWFLGDYLVGMLTIALIYALGTAEFPVGERLAGAAVWLAKVSFSLYLVHLPLLRFFGILLPDHTLAAILIALGCSLSFGAVFEPQNKRLRRALTLAVTH